MKAVLPSFCTKLVETAPANNVRIYEGDARDIIEALPDAELGARSLLLFPDPWPKRRHHKRRFLQMAMLDALARVMKPGAELRFASDDATYVDFALERLLAHPSFDWTGRKGHLRTGKPGPPTGRPPVMKPRAIKGPPASTFCLRLCVRRSAIR